MILNIKIRPLLSGLPDTLLLILAGLMPLVLVALGTERFDTFFIGDNPVYLACLLSVINLMYLSYYETRNFVFSNKKGLISINIAVGVVVAFATGYTWLFAILFNLLFCWVLSYFLNSFRPKSKFWSGLTQLPASIMIILTIIASSSEIGFKILAYTPGAGLIATLLH